MNSNIEITNSVTLREFMNAVELIEQEIRYTGFTAAIQRGLRKVFDRLEVSIGENS